MNNSEETQNPPAAAAEDTAAKIRLELAQEAARIWEANAGWWDETIGEGNQFHQALVSPSVERLLAIKPGERILDIACGNGNFSRRLAALGGQVVAFDASPTFIERAQARTIENAERIAYRQIDAMDKTQLLSLGEGTYDAAVCNMALMDIADISVLLECTRRLLQPAGRFVFSIMHPCFNSIGSSKVLEEEDQDGTLVTRYAIKVSGYITPMSRKGLGIIGQPQAHYYFHRPLSLLLQQCFKAGLTLTGLEEPVFTSGAKPNRPFSWANYTEIPPALVARLRPEYQL